MEWLLIAAGAVIVIFGTVVLFGAPYLPSLSSQIGIALELVDLTEGQHLLELGCGDGKVVIAAAERGLRVTGYELNPILALISWIRTRRYKGRVKIIWGNFWWRRLPACDGIFVFLLPKYMGKLDKKITQDMKLWLSDSSQRVDGQGQPGLPQGSRVKLVSFAFKIPNKTITAQREGVFLYGYKVARTKSS